MSGFIVLEPAVRQADLVLAVRCAATGVPLEAARVRLRSDDARFQRLLTLKRRQWGAQWDQLRSRLDLGYTAPDGIVWFSGLVSADYTVEVDLPPLHRRYGTAGMTLRLEEDGHERVVPVSAGLALPPTLLRGVVRQGDAPLATAEVRLDGSSGRAFTGIDGGYVFIGIEPGPRQVAVFARGRELAGGRVDVERGGTATLELLID